MSPTRRTIRAGWATRRVTATGLRDGMRRPAAKRCSRRLSRKSAAVLVNTRTTASSSAHAVLQKALDGHGEQDVERRSDQQRQPGPWTIDHLVHRRARSGEPARVIRT